MESNEKTRQNAENKQSIEWNLENWNGVWTQFLSIDVKTCQNAENK